MQSRHEFFKAPTNNEVADDNEKVDPGLVSPNSVATFEDKIAKKVKFNNLVRVTLIPQCIEYIEAGLFHQLWESSLEQEERKANVGKEVVSYMYKHQKTKKDLPEVILALADEDEQNQINNCLPR